MIITLKEKKNLVKKKTCLESRSERSECLVPNYKRRWHRVAKEGKHLHNITVSQARLKNPTMSYSPSLPNPPIGIRIHLGKTKNKNKI